MAVRTFTKGLLKPHHSTVELSPRRLITNNIKESISAYKFQRLVVGGVHFFSFIFFLDFYFYFILLYNTVLVLPYIDMNPPWVYMRSQT